MRKLILWIFMLTLPVNAVAETASGEALKTLPESHDSGRKSKNKMKEKKPSQPETFSEHSHQLEESVAESEPLERTIGATLAQELGINNRSIGPSVGFQISY